MDDFDRKWKRIQDLIGADLHGDAPPVVRSQRTLFGIRSSVEEQVERIVAEDEAARKEKRGNENPESREG